MRIIFAGTPHFADVALQALLAAGHSIVAVLTQPDRPAGRGLKLTPSPVKLTALAQGIPVHQPRSLRLDGKYPEDAAAAQALLRGLQADIMVVAAYGLILPQWALDTPRAGCVNLHASLLPRWRGAAPIQRAIQAGDTQSGVCLMHMEAGLDTGPVYATGVVDIAADTTGGALLATLSECAAQLICKHIGAIVAGTLTAVPQAEQGVVYADKLARADGELNWALPATQLAMQVRAFDPVPGCSFAHGGLVYKVWAAKAEPSDTKQAAGTVLSLGAQSLRVACGVGVLNITEIQKPSGRRLPIAEAWQGLLSLQGMLLSKGAA